MLYGSKMDLSVAGYFTVLPGLLLIFSWLISGRMLARIIAIYTGVVLVICVFLVGVDMELYRFWGFRLDATPLMYLKTPKEAFGSANLWVSVLLLFFWLACSWGFFLVYKRTLGKGIKALEPAGWKIMPVFMLLTALLILPIRGSLGIAPMNIGFVYFHKSNNFANHAAVNVFWNVCYSLTTYNKFKPSIYLDRNRAEQILGSIYSQKGIPEYLLNTNRPNIILVIVESFNNKLIEPLGGIKGLTPNINALFKEGIGFSNFYASGDRTDKGIVALLNGYPPIPNGSIINFPKKTESLPYLNSDLKKEGYQVQFLQGFDIDFANMRSYFVNAKYDKVITRADFPPSQYNKKWGAHDGYLFNRLFSECNAVTGRPFFMAVMTQSSHEPFDVPMKTVVHGNDEEHLFLNAAVYTDSCIGDFIRKAKTTAWWKNTLFVMVADHGSRHPGNTKYDLPPKFHIPMLWLGGAIAKHDTVINTYFSQIDFPLTLLHQLKLENTRYRFSKDFMSKTSPEFSFYTFNNGFVLLNGDCHIQVDNASQKTVIETGINTPTQIERGKALMQVLTTDFSER
jgi:phosphoglycerol transferase MdoB-like AlkP superfamily enzyme